jgi:hypothetical protein
MTSVTWHAGTDAVSNDGWGQLGVLNPPFAKMGDFFVKRTLVCSTQICNDTCSLSTNLSCTIANPNMPWGI